MNRLSTQTVFKVLLMATLARGAAAQSTSDQNSSGAAPAATGLDTTTEMSENPPLSGLDQPSFEPGFGTRSYLAPRAEVSEDIDSNGLGNFSNANVNESSRAIGSLELQKLWKLHPLDVDYIGGVDWYNGPNGRVYQLHSLAATQRFLWRTGQLALRDSLSYLPEGTFGFGSFGGAGAVGGGLGNGGIPGGGIAGGTGAGILSNASFGSIGTQLTNMAIADVTQYLSPRSAIVVTAAYGLTDFLNKPQTSSCVSNASCYFNSQETIAQVGYNRHISRKDQIALVYAYEQLHFPAAAAGSLNVNLWQLEYGHRVSGKLDFFVGGGPEWVHRSQPEEELLGAATGVPCVGPTGAPAGLLACVNVKSSFLTGSAQASLRYRMSARTNLLFTYQRYISSGSGFYGGANTDSARFAVSHTLTRRWTMLVDTGYSRNSRLLGATSIAAGGTANYDYWYAGGEGHRQLGRHFAAFVSYQYNAFGFGSNGCSGTVTNCGRAYGRNILLLGLNWTPQPIRLD
jgi:hypothetical protein